MTFRIIDYTTEYVIQETEDESICMKSKVILKHSNFKDFFKALCSYYELKAKILYKKKIPGESIFEVFVQILDVNYLIKPI